jgi:hypothetical protein
VRDTARRQDGWRIGPGTITWHSGDDVAALLIWGGQGRVLMVERDKLFLYPLQGRQAARDEMLAWTALEPPLRDWLGGGDGRAALAMWALWAGELGTAT